MLKEVTLTVCKLNLYKHIFVYKKSLPLELAFIWEKTGDKPIKLY